MKHLEKIVLFIASLILFSCTEEVFVKEVNQHDLLAVTQSYQYQNGTRLAISQDLQTFTWSDGDKLGLYYEGVEEDAGAWFKVRQGGSSIGTFTNEGYAVRPNKTYYAFYPHDYYATVEASPFDLTGMVQTGNNSTTHIGSRNYMYAVANTDASGDITLNFNNICAVVQLKFIAPIAGTYTSVSLSSENTLFTTKGTVNLKNGAITPTETNRSIMLSLGEGMELQQNESFTANLLVAPGDFSADTLSISLSINGKLYKSTISGLKIDAGKAYQIESNNYTLNGYYRSTDYTLDKTLAKTFQISAYGESNGADIIIVGDGFTDADLSSGYYDEVMQQAYDDFFAIEPFTTLKNRFNVYSVYAVSENQKLTETPSDGINGAINIDGVNTCFSSMFTDNSTSTSGDNSKVYEYAKVALGANANTRIRKALVLVMINANRYSGTCHYMIPNSPTDDYGMNSSAIAYIPLGIAINGKSATTMRRSVLHHEANGHGFGKLADEYWTNSYPTSTGPWQELKEYHSQGLFRNVDAYVNAQNASQTSWPETTAQTVYWHNLYNTANHYETTEGLGIYEGAYTYIYHFCRPTDYSIMRNNDGGFNAPSRWAIYYRIMKLSGSTQATSFESSLNEFLVWDRTIDYNQANTLKLTRSLHNEANGLKPLGEVQITRGEWVNGLFVH